MSILVHVLGSNELVLKEIQKTSIEKISNVKRERRRKRLQPFFYIAVVILVLVLIITLSMTVLFNIKTIKVDGSSEYEASQIVDASQIYKGDNLVRLNTELAKQRILTNLMYIDDVTIKKEFPSTLVIETVASVPAMNIQNGNEYIIVSEGLKRLSDSTEPREDLLKVVGFEPDIASIDTKLSSKDEQKPKILNTIYTQLKELDMLENIVSVDITDKYDIMINYSDRVFIQLGAYSDLEYKIRYANTVITQNLPEQKSGYLVFVSYNEASFIDKDKYEVYCENVENATVTSKLTTDNLEEMSSSYTDTVSSEEISQNEEIQYTQPTTEYSSEMDYTINNNVGNDVQIIYGSN